MEVNLTGHVCLCVISIAPGNVELCLSSIELACRGWLVGYRTSALFFRTDMISILDYSLVTVEGNISLSTRSCFFHLYAICLAFYERVWCLVSWDTGRFGNRVQKLHTHCALRLKGRKLCINATCCILDWQYCCYALEAERKAYVSFLVSYWKACISFLSRVKLQQMRSKHSHRHCTVLYLPHCQINSMLRLMARRDNQRLYT